jgi:hypothetical protein
MTARLQRDDRGRPYWEDSGQAAELHELQIGTGGCATIEKLGARLHDEPLDLDRQAPIAFHLLHGPDGNDTLILRFTHVLMDGKAPEWVLRCLHEYFENRPEAQVAASQPIDRMLPDDEMDSYLYRFKKRRRLRSALSVIVDQVRRPMKPVTMTPPKQKGWLIRPTGLMVRTLDESAAAALTDRVKRLCGFPNLTPALVASTFRAIGRCTPQRVKDRTWFQTDCPLNLRPPGVGEPIFRNFMSFVQFSAQQKDLTDCDEATRRLSAQMRDQLRRGIDLGNLQMMTIMSRFAPRLRPLIVAHLKHRPFTIGFGYLGPVISVLSRFCGQEVENVHSFNTSIAPPGVTIAVNQFDGRINLMLTYTASAVPDGAASSLLDEIAGGLRGDQSLRR